jgi:hypothetical protein
MIYFEGPPIVNEDQLWTLPNTLFQIRFDTRQSSTRWANPNSTAWAGNGYPGDSPWPAGGFRPLAAPDDFAMQVVLGLSTLYNAVPQWPATKPKQHAFEFIGVNGLNSPWRDHDNPLDYIPYGGAVNRIEPPYAMMFNIGSDQALVASEELFTNLGGPVWTSATAYEAGAIISGGQWRWVCTTSGGGTSGSPAPDWDSPTTINNELFVADGPLTWKRIGFDPIMVTGFDKAANNRVFEVVRKPANYVLFIESYRYAAGGEPNRIIDESQRQGVRINLLFGPDPWRKAGRDSNAGRAHTYFQSVKNLLAVPDILPADISRTFDHFVEDDEAGSEMKNSVASFNINTMPEWPTQGYWQRNIADPRFSSSTVDGVYSAKQLLNRAQSVLSNGSALPDPFVGSIYSPLQTTLRAWQWINLRAIQSVIANQRFKPFRQVFGNVPCGNWNNGATSGDTSPATWIVHEPFANDPSTGIAIDNYQDSSEWGMSIPAMYGGVLGDYRNFNQYLTDESPFWSTEQNWFFYAQALGYPTSVAPANYPSGVTTSNSALAFQIGECALTEYAKTIKRNYGYSHIVMPSLDLQYIPPTSNMSARKWTITRLAQSLARQYKAGLVDRVWAFTPQDAYSGSQDLRDAWYSLSKQVYRLTTCPVDYNASGTTSIDDLFAFMSLWFAGEPEADFDQNGQISIDDLFTFLSAWFSGC